MALVSIKLLQAAFEPKHIAAALYKCPQPQRHNQASDSQSFTTDKKWPQIGSMWAVWLCTGIWSWPTDKGIGFMEWLMLLGCRRYGHRRGYGRVIGGLWEWVLTQRKACRQGKNMPVWLVQRWGWNMNCPRQQAIWKSSLTEFSPICVDNQNINLKTA